MNCIQTASDKALVHSRAKIGAILPKTLANKAASQAN
jgi:hypothetical protein